MEKNERIKLLKKYYSSNGTFTRIVTISFCMLPVFFMIYEPLPREVSLHILIFSQTILFLLIFFASQINMKLDLIMKIYNLDRQGDEFVDYEPKKKIWAFVLAAVIMVVVLTYCHNIALEKNKAIWDRLDQEYRSTQEQKSGSLAEEKDTLDKQLK